MPDSNSGNACLYLSGRANIHAVGEILKKLTSYYGQKDTIILDLNGIEDADLTFIQLLEATRKSATKDGKRLSLTKPIPNALRDTLQRGGFLADQASREFWT